MSEREGFNRSAALPLLVEAFSGKNRVICGFREIARNVARVNSLVADVDEILFIIDNADKGGKSGSEIFKVPQVWRDVLYQLTFKKFDFLIRFYSTNLEAMAGNPKVFKALVYHELRHIKRNPKTGELYLDTVHDVEEFAELVPFGNWELDESAAAKLPDFMEAALCG